MHTTKRRGSMGVIVAALFFLAPARTPAQDLVVGVNVVNPVRASVADQNAVFSQPEAACETQSYQRLRSAGFLYSTAQPNTQPLYRCYSGSEKSHFPANSDDCNNMGKQEALLGYDLKQ